VRQTGQPPANSRRIGWLSRNAATGRTQPKSITRSIAGHAQDTNGSNWRRGVCLEGIYLRLRTVVASAQTQREAPEAERGSVLFSAWVLVVLIGALPSLWALLALTPSARKADRLVRTWARGVIRLSCCGLRVSGMEHLQHQPCAVMVANHSSFLDSVVLLAAVPADYRFVVNHLAATRPLVGLAIRRSGHLVVDRRSARSRAE
jgi:hypothetical protein